MDDDMVILYDFASNKTPIWTPHGYLPRFEWLVDQAEKMKKRGRRVELVVNEEDHTSALFVDKKFIVRKPSK